MEGVKLCVVIALTATFVAGLRNVIQYEMEQQTGDEERLIQALWREELLAKTKPVKLQKFASKDCSDGKGLMNIKSLVITPDPVAVPGPLNVAASIDVTTKVISPLKGNVTMFWYKLGRWIKLPCIDNFGTCIYDNVCDLLGQITQCPDPLKKIGLDCHCPFNPATYTLPQTEFDIDASVFPTGDFRITGNLTYNGLEAACLNLNITFA